MSSDKLLGALSRGRNDIEFFWWFFLGCRPHPGQLEFAEGAQATVNALACSNRWGKTKLLPGLHYHAQIYKTGAESRYLLPDGRVDQRAFQMLRYRTIHTADEWELAALVWDEALKMLSESEPLRAFVRDAPRSKPPHIDFSLGGRWKFRTLGANASGIDGDSYYLITIDEAGWITDLAEKMENVIRIRVADVRGRIVIVGTFKPGVSRDFYQTCVRAAAHCGRDIAFDHRGESESEIRTGGLDVGIRRLLEGVGVSPDEFAAAVTDDL